MIILSHPFILRFLVAAVSGLNRSLEGVREAHQRRILQNIGRIEEIERCAVDRIVALRAQNAESELESRRANKIAAKLRDVIED